MKREAIVARSRGAAVAIVGGALLLAALVVQNGVAGVGRYNAVDTALKWAPGDARALAGAAELALPAGADAAQRKAAAELARASIARDATLGTPFRVLGFVADMDGDAARAKALFNHAGTLSKRDFQTQVWLIEDAAARFDHKATLYHYDVALRTSSVAPGLLFPVLAGALSEPDIVAAVADTLARRPPWRSAFLADAFDKSTETPGLVALTEALAARKSPIEPIQAQQLLNRLTERRDFASLARIRHQMLPAAERDRAIADGRFTDTAGRYPFAWALSEGDGVAARRATAGDGGRLTFDVGAGRGGELARQLMSLKPGRYTLQWSAVHDARDAAAAPIWSITCGETPTRGLANLVIPVGQGLQRGTGSFVVPPSGCAGQWLVLGLRAANSATPVRGAVTQVEAFAG